MVLEATNPAVLVVANEAVRLRPIIKSKMGRKRSSSW